ncbi:MAG: LysM peptidoglycan-binding domain-containing protein [Acidimicrobiia bacterium]|nr:LysM peptidoglycan-binding domain-containing protein [Acidimicrobiia bacterium]
MAGSWAILAGVGWRRQRSRHRALAGVALLAVPGAAAGCREDAPAAQPPVTVTIETTTIPTAPPSAPPPSTTSTTVAGVAYVVVSGDTVSGIAARFGVSVAAIISANPIADPSVLSIGQTLIVPAAQGATTTTLPTQ